MKQVNLTVSKRSIIKKNASFKLRQKESVPGILYGPEKENISVTVPGKAILSILNDKSNVNCIINLSFEDDPSLKKLVMIKTYQTDPVKNRLQHIDFYEISMDREMSVTIPIRLIGKPKGLIDGGILEQSLREIDIKCLPDRIPEIIEVDISNLGLNDSVHLEQIKMPEGVKVVTDLKRTIAVVTVPKEEEVKTEEAAATEGDAAAAPADAKAADGKAADAKTDAKAAPADAKGAKPAADKAAAKK